MLLIVSALAGAAACPPGDHWSLLLAMLGHVQGALMDADAPPEQVSASRRLQGDVERALRCAAAGQLLGRHGLQLPLRGLTGLAPPQALLLVKQLLAKAQR